LSDHDQNPNHLKVKKIWRDISPIKKREMLVKRADLRKSNLTLRSIRRVHVTFRREGFRGNHKRVYRLNREALVIAAKAS
jgi:hypothetical protein